METSQKLHVWIILLLVWNIALLALVIGLVYFRPVQTPGIDAIAQECGAATVAALNNACTKN